MEMGNHVIGVVQVQVRKIEAQRQTGQSANSKHRQERQRKKHRHRETNRTTPQRNEKTSENDHRRDRNDHRRGLEEGGDFGSHAGQIHVVRPDDERQEADAEHRIDQRLVTPDRLARVIRDDFADNAHRRQNQYIDLRMSEEPEQVLPEQRASTAADRQWCGRARSGQAGGQEKARARHVVHQLQDGRRFQRRKCQQQQEGGDELRPDKKWQPHPGHSLGPQLNDRGDEIDRAQQRRSDQQHHPENPERLSVGVVPHVR